MANTRGFEMVTFKKLTNNAFYIRVNVTDAAITLHSILLSLIDLSWINRFFPENNWLRSSIEARVMPTVNSILSDFNQGINTSINRHTGEKLVSEISRRTLVDDFNFLDLPIAELFKQKVDGNPGFDFHTVTPSDFIIMFGEAKYKANTTAYNAAMNQITDFINDEKDLKDLLDLRDFMPSQQPLDNAYNNIKGYIAAFSTNGKDDDYIIDKIINHQHYQQLSNFSQFIAITIAL